MKHGPSKKAKQQFQNAMQALNSGQAEEALSLFKKVKRSWRDDADIGYLEGLAYGRLGDMKGVEAASRRALKMNPDHFGALCNLANAQMAANDMESAFQNYQKALKAKPDAPEVMNNYGRALMMTGRYEEAVDAYEKALANSPDHAPAHVSLGLAYTEAGYPGKAMEHFQQALQYEPDSLEAYVGLGTLYARQGGIYLAEHYYKKALELDKRLITVYLGLANIARHHGNYDESLRILTDAEEVFGDNDFQLTAYKADILEHKGEKDAAYELLNELSEAGLMLPAAVAAFARLSIKYGRQDDALNLINEAVLKPTTNIPDRQYLMYTAGSLLDKLKRYDEAFEYYEKANSMVGIRCDREKYINDIDRVIEVFSRDRIKSLPRTKTSSTRPVFVLGMPRSGTTLTEQILAAHPDVFAAGELPYMKNIVMAFTQSTNDNYSEYCDRLLEANDDDITSMANRYLKELNTLNRSAKFVVDKMPHNFFYIGLISLMFPDAKIIHCQRNPLDTSLSIFFQSFIWSHDYATDLSDIGFFYKQYERLMNHWESVIEQPILKVQYEDLINDQEGMSRRLLEFCGLEWKDDVLNFHEVERDVGTASYDQVRQPIYTSSRERWRNYEKYIGPLMDELGMAEV